MCLREMPILSQEKFLLYAVCTPSGRQILRNSLEVAPVQYFETKKTLRMCLREIPIKCCKRNQPYIYIAWHLVSFVPSSPHCSQKSAKKCLLWRFDSSSSSAAVQSVCEKIQENLRRIEASNYRSHHRSYPFAAQRIHGLLWLCCHGR